MWVWSLICFYKFMSLSPHPVCSTGDQTQYFVHAKQALFKLSYIPDAPVLSSNEFIESNTFELTKAIAPTITFVKTLHAFWKAHLTVLKKNVCRYSLTHRLQKCYRTPQTRKLVSAAVCQRKLLVSHKRSDWSVLSCYAVTRQILLSQV